MTVKIWNVRSILRHGYENMKDGMINRDMDRLGYIVGMSLCKYTFKASTSVLSIFVHKTYTHPPNHPPTHPPTHSHLFPGRQRHAALYEAALVKDRGSEGRCSWDVDEVKLLIKSWRCVIDLHIGTESLRIARGWVKHREPHIAIHLPTLLLQTQQERCIEYLIFRNE